MNCLKSEAYFYYLQLAVSFSDTEIHQYTAFTSVEVFCCNNSISFGLRFKFGVCAIITAEWE